MKELQTELNKWLNEWEEKATMDLRNKIPFFMQHCAGYYDIVAGTSPLLLPKAKANGLDYVKAFGKCKQSNLPEGYTEYDGLIGDGSAYLDLNCSLDENDEIEIEFTKNISLVSKDIFGGRTSASANNISLILAGSGNVVEDFNNSDYTPYRLNVAVNLNGKYRAVINKNGRYVYKVSDGSLVGSNTTVCEDAITTTGCYVFSLAGTGLGQKFGGIINRVYIKGKRDLRPAGNGTAYGMYDLLNNVFYENAGEGSFTVGNEIIPTPDTPVDIICNNGVLKYSANMANVNAQTALLGYYISAQGVVTADANNWIYQQFIPVKPNTTYTLSISSAVYFVSISEYATADDSGFIVRNIGSTGENTTLTITTSATTNFVRFGTNIDRTEVTLEEVLAINWMLNEGETALPYTPYSESGIYIYGTAETVSDSLNNTATAQNLLSVNDYKDTQEIFSGAVVRNVGIKVFDGTENWAKISNQNAYYTALLDMLYTNPVQAGLSNKFIGAGVSTAEMPDKSIKLTYTSDNKGAILFKYNSCTTLESWVQFVKEQYDAGTPIIAIYPLATPATETVAGQILNTKEGSNSLTITQASLEGLTLEARYKRGR